MWLRYRSANFLLEGKLCSDLNISVDYVNLSGVIPCHTLMTKTVCKLAAQLLF